MKNSSLFNSIALLIAINSINGQINDADFDNLTYSIVSNPSNGTISLSGDIVTYTPTTDYTGTDTFTFKANDGALDSATKTVTVKVISGYKTTQTQILIGVDIINTTWDT